jgi:hypothetical protein
MESMNRRSMTLPGARESLFDDGAVTGALLHPDVREVHRRCRAA